MDRLGTRASLDAWFDTVDELLDEQFENRKSHPVENRARHEEDVA